MTQRERHTPEGGAPATPALTAPPGAGLGCVWEDLLPSLPPARGRELLELAARQGVLYAHQLPAGNGSAAPVAHAPRLAVLPALLNGQTHDLLPLRPTPIDCNDAALDAGQRDAVARALQTPDLCLIQGHPGSGKSRTAAEIAAQAAARGERVLLLAPTAAAVDCVLEGLAGRAGVCPVRCLAAGESAESLPPGLRRLVFEERLRLFREQTLPAAKQALEEASRRCAVRRNDEAVWVGLEELARRREEADEAGRRIADGMVQVEEEVAAEAAVDGTSPFQQACAACRKALGEALARIDARQAELQAETAKVRGEQRGAAEEEARLRPLADALRAGRWWAAAWWCARRQGDLLRRLEELENRQKGLKAADERLTQESAEQTAERGRAETLCKEETDELRRREVERRRAEREARRTALARDGGAGGTGPHGGPRPERRRGAAGRAVRRRRARGS